ncbi:MAG: DUF1523 family protein [Rubrimonas sp.]|uniref:DUF1523 family protein n=1 Tax=Rubrimonas sp. TaxID=2036015 RepID=UPI002FDD0D26
MVWVGRGLFAAAFLALAALVWWSAPSHSVVRILDTDVVRMNVETTNAQGDSVTRTRDVRFINAVTPSGRPAVFRNEDTGWGWPPYFKFDSANLSAAASNLASTEAEPRWVVLTHYGLRLTWFSMFPNALGVSPAEGPDQTAIPWIRIVALAALALGMLTLRRLAIMAFGGSAP